MYIINRIKSSYRRKKLYSKWQSLNNHNYTFLDLLPINEAFFDQVIVGNMTYGPIYAPWSGNPKEKLVIGSYCSIGSGTKFIMGSEHKYDVITTYPFKVKLLGEEYEAVTKGPIILGDDVWIGEDALILSGVNIGQGAIIAARSVVVKDIEPYSIVGGNPAKEIKKRFSDNIIEKLIQGLRLNDLNNVNIRNKINYLYQKIDENNVDEILEEMYER